MDGVQAVSHRIGARSAEQALGLLLLLMVSVPLLEGPPNQPRQGYAGDGTGSSLELGSSCESPAKSRNKKRAGTAARSTAAVPTQDRRERELTPAPP
jgi:hypothetical protein